MKPTIRQWKAFYAILNRREKITISILIFIIILTGTIWYFRNTHAVPAFGGEYKEAVVGNINLINPLIAQTDADRDIVSLVFSGLMKYDENGNIIPDLAENYEISQDGKTYTFYLRDAKWHDGKKVTADDVVFTILVIQNSDYKSSERINWLGVKAEKMDEKTVQLTLKESYAPFIENATLSIIPKHIFESIQPKNFALAEANLKPIGSGPYKYKSSNRGKDESFESYSLEANPNYYFKPFIKYLTFIFFNNENGAIGAYQAGKVQGVNFILAQNKNPAFQNSIRTLRLSTYFALFFNQTKNKSLADKNVREALALGLNKKEMVEKSLLDEAEIINSIFFPFQLGYTEETKIYDFDIEKAKLLLKKSKIKNIEITVVTSDWPEFVKTAEVIKKNWENIGIKVNLEIKKANELQQDFIRPRNYEVLLFGISSRIDPDPFPFWHSSQKRDPGLNFSLYDNSSADKLLLEARQNMDEDLRAKKYEDFQQILTNDLPAIFLYSPNYLYLLNKDVKGFDVKNISLPSKRFVQINEWYIKTKRAF